MQVSAAFSMKIRQFVMEEWQFSSVPFLLQLSGGEVQSSVALSLTILQSVALLHVIYMSIAVTSTTAVHHPLSVMYCRLGMKRGVASGFKVSLFFWTIAINNIQALCECIA